MSVSIIRSRYSDLKEGSILTQTDEQSEEVYQFLVALKTTYSESLFEFRVRERLSMQSNFTRVCSLSSLTEPFIFIEETS